MRASVRWIGATILLLAIAGCDAGDDGGGRATPTSPPASPTATQTESPPTATNTPVSTATNTRLSTATPTETPTTGVRALRSVPYDVRDTAQPGQLTIYNANRGGGSVGMPVRFGDIDGDGHGDFIACPMLADSGPNADREKSGELHVYFGDGTIGGVIVNTPESSRIMTIMGARPTDLLGNEPHVTDIDGDGLADMLIGSQNYDGLAGDRHNAGGVFLYFGRRTNPRFLDLATLPLDPAPIITIEGAEEGDRLGIWVTTGDVDGDGKLDLLLGADQSDGPSNDRPDSGSVTILFGGQELPAVIDLAAPGDLRMATIHGVDAGDHFGSTIVTDDVDEDGFDDILVAAGLARGSSQIDGTFLAGADGPENARRDAGDVYLLFGRAEFPSVVDVAAVPEAERVTMYGANVADVAGEDLAIGDLDGDGNLDLAIGSLQASGPGGPGSDRGPATGRTYLVFNGASRRGNVIDFANPGEGVTTIFGRRPGSISGDTMIVVDMDGDGFGDLWDASPMLGTRDHEGTFRGSSGVLDVLFGSSAWPAKIDLLLPPDDLRLATIYGPDAGDAFAYGLAVGDANGDERPDFIINAMAGDGFENQAPDAGEMYVLDNGILFDTEAAERPPLFLNLDIQPIFRAACLPCHAGEEPEGDLRLDIIQNSMVDLLGENGEGRQSTQVESLLVAPGDADASYLIEKLESESPRAGERMPLPPADRLPARVVDEMRRWIEEGARVANEDLPPPPPTPGPPAEGFAATFFTRIRLVLSDPGLGEIESVLIDPPAPIPLRLMGPRLTVPASEYEMITIPGGAFGDVKVDLRENGVGTIDRSSGDIELSITFIQIALDGAVEVTMPVTLTTGAAADGPFVTQGRPLDFIGGNLKLVGIARIPLDSPAIPGDPILVELEGSVSPVPPMVPALSDEVQPIFTTSCAIANCHIGDGAAQLNLEAGRAFAELVGVPSTQVDSLLVVPGDPDASYLFEKITNEEPRQGDRMPIGNALDPLDVEAVRQWIEGGAPE